MNATTWFIRSAEEQGRCDVVAGLADSFALTARKHDEDGSFPHENIAMLRESGYVSWTLPQANGGQGISLYELLLHQERLAQGDASTALAIGWHMGILLSLRTTRVIPEDTFGDLCNSIIEHGALINSCASEPATGSPSRGGRPTTTATRVDGGYRISGRKTWSSLSPELAWVIVTASMGDSEQVGEFLMPMAGIEIETTWNAMGMRATGSDDLVLRDVFVPERALIGTLLPGGSSARNSDGSGWLLHIPACYLGIAMHARDFALQYASAHQPNSITQPIASLHHVQAKLGQIEMKLLAARTLMYDMARRWDEAAPEERRAMKPQLGAAKTLATNSAIEIVDLCMRVVGGKSLSKELVLEQLYRDVRAGLHNPPMDDAVLTALAASALRMYQTS